MTLVFSWPVPREGLIENTLAINDRVLITPVSPLPTLPKDISLVPGLPGREGLTSPSANIAIFIAVGTCDYSEGNELASTYLSPLM